FDERLPRDDLDAQLLQTVSDTGQADDAHTESAHTGYMPGSANQVHGVSLSLVDRGKLVPCFTDDRWAQSWTSRARKRPRDGARSRNGLVPPTRRCCRWSPASTSVAGCESGPVAPPPAPSPGPPACPPRSSTPCRRLILGGGRTRAFGPSGTPRT